MRPRTTYRRWFPIHSVPRPLLAALLLAAALVLALAIAAWGADDVRHCNADTGTYSRFVPMAWHRPV